MVLSTIMQRYNSYTTDNLRKIWKSHVCLVLRLLKIVQISFGDEHLIYEVMHQYSLGFSINWNFKMHNNILSFVRTLGHRTFYLFCPLRLLDCYFPIISILHFKYQVHCCLSKSCICLIFCWFHESKRVIGLWRRKEFYIA